MNKFVLRVVCTGKEAKIEWENTQQLHADSLLNPRCEREEKEKSRLETGAGAVLHFERGVTASASSGETNKLLTKIAFRGPTAVRKSRGPRAWLLRSRLKRRNRTVGKKRKRFAFCWWWEKCLPRTRVWKMRFLVGLVRVCFLLTYSAVWLRLGAAAAQHRFYVCEKQIKFYAIGRSSAGGGAQLPFFVVCAPPTTRETDRPPLWAHRFSALAPRARIIESKCQAPHTHTHEKPHEKPLETHTDCQQQNVLRTHTLEGITARDKTRKWGERYEIGIAEL